MDASTLAAAFAQTTSPEPGPRKAAEEFLQQAAAQPGFGLLVLQLSALGSLEEHVRQAAAVAFKNHVKFQWAPPLPPADGTATRTPLAMGAAEKEQIKASVVATMLGQPPRVQAQLSEALALMAASDFPEHWPNLLPELVAQLRSPDAAVVNGALTTGDAIFRRFRGQYQTVELVKDIKYVLSLLAMPLLELLQVTGTLLAGPQGAQPETARPRLTTVLLICRIFYSLNCQELPEVFEDTMAAWMAEFQKYLAYNNPALAESDTTKASIVDEIKASICENVSLYLEKNEEEFAPFVRDFATAVWGQLMQVGLEPGKDALATEAIRFLTTLVSGVHHTLFQDEDGSMLRTIIHNIVIPNLRFRDSDEELFEDNYVEYIRRDIEGSDTDTRRRMACELLKALTSKFQQAVTQAVSGYVATLLAEYAAAPDGAWKQKDCAVYLVIALTVRGKSEAKGATATNELVNIGDFFSAHIVPELQVPLGRGQPVLKADALKFVTTFRQQIPKASCLTLLPPVASLLASEHNVVHTYAALCVERMLTVRDAGAPRFTAADLLPLRDVLLGNLFGALTRPDSGENDYVMKAIMRLLSTLGPECAPVAVVCMERLAALLMAQARNPRNPLFSHYLFEAMALVVRHTAGQAELAAQLEALVFPPFQAVLQADVAEFAPYVFQILAQLLEARPSPLPGQYMLLFPPLLSPQLWERPANVPALVRLLEAYLQRASLPLVQGGHLGGVLGVFQKLNASRAHDHEGFYILNALVQHLEAPAWEAHLPALWSLLLQRLQHSRTPKYTRSFCVFLALLLAKHGPVWTAQGPEAVQPGLFTLLLDQLWLPNLSGVSGDTERRLIAVAAVKVAIQFPPVAAAEAAHPLWPRLVEQAVILLTEEEDTAAGAGADGDGDADEEPGSALAAHPGGSASSASYARLASAARPEMEPVAEVRDAKRFMAVSLAHASQQQPGRLGARIAASLAPAYQANLAAMCTEAGVAIV